MKFLPLHALRKSGVEGNENCHLETFQNVVLMLKDQSNYIRLTAKITNELQEVILPRPLPRVKQATFGNKI